MKGEETGIGRLATKPQREKPRTPFEFRRNKTNLQRRILILRLCKFFTLLNININYEAYATSLISSRINSITAYAMLQLTSQTLSRSFFRELLVLTRKINFNTLVNRGLGSVVGIATGYGLDGPGIESRWERDFPHLSRPALGPTRPPEK